VIRMAWGASPLQASIPSLFRGHVIIGDFLYSVYRLLMLGVVITALTGIWLLLNKTSFGRVVRAGVQKPDMVAVLGIRLQPYMTSIVVLGVGLAALAGVLFAPISGVHPAMGTEIITAAFVVVVIGGLGSFWGVVLAALLVGVVRGITIHFYTPAGEASMYVLMLLVLLFRPRGLFGERIERFE
jgi:branched-chain amino acid transport system permease protein